MSSRTQRLARLQKRAVTAVALGSAIVIGIEAGAHAQEAGSQPRAARTGSNLVAAGQRMPASTLGGMTAR